jgi:hypothetical protein
MLTRKKHRLKPLSLYPLKPEDVLSALMNKSKTMTKKQLEKKILKWWANSPLNANSPNSVTVDDLPPNSPLRCSKKFSLLCEILSRQPKKKGQSLR